MLGPEFRPEPLDFPGDRPLLSPQVEEIAEENEPHDRERGEEPGHIDLPFLGVMARGLRADLPRPLLQPILEGVQLVAERLKFDPHSKQREEE